MRHLIDITDLSVAEIEGLMDTAADIAAHPENYRERCRYQKLATLFFEPSTRTRLSFEAAMMELGGQVLGIPEASSSSASKGESMADTAKIVSGYADIIAMRHPREGAALAAAGKADVPVINAGDGGHCHPTQTLTDLFAIRRELGRISDLTVGLCGDLKYGRTVHSLIAALSRYPEIRFVSISPKELQLPDYVTAALDEAGIPHRQTADLESALPQLDVLYMTRIQRERFADPTEYERLKDSYVLDTDKMEAAKETMCVLHPLPRVNEIHPAVDADPRAAYFRQAVGGKYMRMALILKLLDERDRPSSLPTGEPASRRCRNPRCILQAEPALPLLQKGGRCIYCESKI